MRLSLVTNRPIALGDGSGWRLTVAGDGGPATVAEVARAWRDDPAFGEQWNEALANLPSVAFRWELPGAVATSVSQPFESVVLDAPGLDQAPDPRPFAAALARQAESIVAFANLGGDATLVVPRPLGPTAAYGHLASFVRLAPPAQRADFWRVVGATLTDRLGDRPVWLNTAGAGVAWLHARLDSRPKYYRHAPYRQNPPTHRG